jgi:hypothetical protein
MRAGVQPHGEGSAGTQAGIGGSLSLGGRRPRNMSWWAFPPGPAQRTGVVARHQRARTGGRLRNDASVHGRTCTNGVCTPSDSAAPDSNSSGWAVRPGQRQRGIPLPRRAGSTPGSPRGWGVVEPGAGDRRLRQRRSTRPVHRPPSAADPPDWSRAGLMLLRAPRRAGLLVDAQPPGPGRRGRGCRDRCCGGTAFRTELRVSPGGGRRPAGGGGGEPGGTTEAACMNIAITGGAGLGE